MPSVAAAGRPASAVPQGAAPAKRPSFINRLTGGSSKPAAPASAQYVPFAPGTNVLVKGKFDMPDQPAVVRRYGKDSHTYYVVFNGASSETAVGEAEVRPRD